MSSNRLSIALLALGTSSLGATEHLGSAWPGVVLCGLSMVPHLCGRWVERKETERFQTIKALAIESAGAAADEALSLAKKTAVTVADHGQQINSLRSTVSLRGTLGG